MKKISGLLTAIVTPFFGGEVDYQSLANLIEFQIQNGVEGFVINGTTGESPTITKAEREKIFLKVRDIVGKNMPLIMGTGSNSTQKTKEETQWAKEIGADAALVVVPYYNKPPQRGLYQHFKVVSESADIPVFLYNVPGRTITTLEAKTVSELSACRGIIGIKEASGNIQLEKDIISLCQKKDFILLSGDDGTYVEFLVSGGHGVISVASHIIPKEMRHWRQLVSEGNAGEARKEASQYSKLIDLLFMEANPIPVKAALKLMGVIKSAELRLPLVELEQKNVETLKIEMQKTGVLK